MKNATIEISTLTASELNTYNFCIKMGDTHELAMKGVEITRKQKAINEANDSYYRNAYTN